MKFKNLFLASFCAIIFFASCKKKNEMDEQTRLFRPVIAGQLSTVNNAIVASWQNIRGAASYTVQVSRDTFRTIDASINVTDTNTIQINDLKWDQLYQIQVKANASDTTFNSRWSFLGAIKVPKFPTILNTPASSDVTEEAIRVSWTNSGAPVTSIRELKQDSSLVRNVALTSADITNQYKVIAGLSPNTTYIILLFSGNALRGFDNYTTKAPLSGTIIDLRNITGVPSVLADTLPLIPAGSTVVLKRGETYNIATAVNLSKAVKIISGSNLTVADPAVIFFTSNFNFAAASTIDYIDFQDVILRSDSYASRYVFNTTGSANVGRISFENCQVEIFRGIVRLQSGNTTVSNFNVNNCILDSLSGYGVITFDNVTCMVENISLKNSTIYKAEKIITSRQNSSSIIMENLTINEAPWGNNYVIDYSTSGTNNVTNGIKIANCIFGIGKSNAGVLAVRGIRVGTGSVEVVNSYTTADYTLAAATPAPIPNVIAYTRKSTELWQDPTNGNFKIIDQSFPGKSTTGDPRWR